MDDGVAGTATPPADQSTNAPRARRRGRGRGSRAIVAVVVVILVVVALTAAVVVGPRVLSRHPSVDLGTRTPGYLVSVDELHQRASLAGSGREPYASAVADLLRYAATTVDAAPNPKEPLEITGTEGPFVDDAAAAYGLGLAWVVTGDAAYARSSAAIIDAWVATTRTTVGTCPSDGICQTSLIIGRTSPDFVFAADLLRGSSAFPAADENAFRSWLANVILPTASELPNNWGDAGTFLRVVATDYLGDTSGLKAAVERWFVQQDRVAADGHIPEETRRGLDGMAYTQEALQYRVAVAVIAERYGIDLWAYRGEGGATLREAVDYLARYWARPDAWPWAPNVERPSTGPLWELTFQRFRAPGYVPIIEERRPFGSQGHSALRWTTLTNGVPLDTPPPASPT